MRIAGFSDFLPAIRRVCCCADELIEPAAQPYSFGLCQTPAYFAAAPMRADYQPARIRRKSGRAQVNTRPMQGKYRAFPLSCAPACNFDPVGENADHLAIAATMQAEPQRHTQHHHFQARKRQHRPVAQPDKYQRDTQRRRAYPQVEDHCRAPAKAAVRRHLDTVGGLLCGSHGKMVLEPFQQRQTCLRRRLPQPGESTDQLSGIPHKNMLLH